MTDTVGRPTTQTQTTDRPSRLYQALAWVGIIAGIVFIVAVVFFSGFVIGKHTGGHGSHHGQGMYMFHHRGGPMGPGQWGPPGQMGPGGPGGPGGPPPSSPSTTPTPRP